MSSDKYAYQGSALLKYIHAFLDHLSQSVTDNYNTHYKDITEYPCDLTLARKRPVFERRF